MAYDPMDETGVVARTVWAESRSQGRVGMEAVASVIRNRRGAPRWWGRGWLSVCQKPYQFSCWLPTDLNLPKLLAVDETDPQFAMALEIAAAAIAGTLVDPTGGADSYYAVGTRKPRWATDACHTVTIGGHAFYRVELDPPTA